MKAPPPPFRFILNILGGWVALRLCFAIYTPPALSGIAPLLFPDLPIETAASATAPVIPRTAALALPAAAPAQPAAPALLAARARERAGFYAMLLMPGGSASQHLVQARAAAERAERVRRGFTPAFLLPQLGVEPPPADRAQDPGEPLIPGPVRHWSGSAWAYLRDGSGPVAAATAGQLGGSQAGARLAWAPAPDRVPIAIAGRITAPIEGSPGAEAAIGLDWQPVARLPVRVSVNRRVALDRGGRDAWELIAAGGVYARPLPGGLRLDGYAQAGVVGARSRDGFVDGAVRVGRPVAIGPKDATVTLGGGGWGAAQPHVARLDLGPSAVLRMPLGPTAVTVAAEWRFRIAGDARPRSGPSLTIATDF